MVVSYWRFGRNFSPIFKGQLVQEEYREYLGTQFPTWTAYLRVPGIFLGRLDPFDVLLIVHLSIFISVTNQLDAQKFVLQ